MKNKKLLLLFLLNLLLSSLAMSGISNFSSEQVPLIERSGNDEI